MSSPFQQQFSAKSPLNQNRKIIGEDTYNLVKDENSGNFVAGLTEYNPSILDYGSADPQDTKNRLVITPEQKSSMKDNISTNDGEEWIDQFHPMTIKKDSVSGGKTYYGLKNKPIKKGTK